MCKKVKTEEFKISLKGRKKTALIPTWQFI